MKIRLLTFTLIASLAFGCGGLAQETESTGIETSSGALPPIDPTREAGGCVVLNLKDEDVSVRSAPSVGSSKWRIIRANGGSEGSKAENDHV